MLHEKKKKEGAEERGRNRDDDVKERKSQEGEGGEAGERGGIQSEMKTERGRQEDEGRVRNMSRGGRHGGRDLLSLVG